MSHLVLSYKGRTGTLLHSFKKIIKAKVGGASGPYLKHFQGHQCHGVPRFGTFSHRQAAPYFPKNTPEWNPPSHKSL